LLLGTNTILVIKDIKFVQNNLAKRSLGSSGKTNKQKKQQEHNYFYICQANTLQQTIQ